MSGEKGPREWLLALLIIVGTLVGIIWAYLERR